MDGNGAQNAIASTSTPQKEGKEKKEKPKSKTAQQVIKAHFAGQANCKGCYLIIKICIGCCFHSAEVFVYMHATHDMVYQLLKATLLNAFTVN